MNNEIISYFSQFISVKVEKKFMKTSGSISGKIKKIEA